MRKYVVEIQPDCWLAPWSGDPGRTLVIDNARMFDTYVGAHNAMCRMRKNHPSRFPPFAQPKVIEVDVSVVRAVDAAEVKRD